MTMATGTKPAAGLSDQELMRLVQRADDQEAFACLYDRYAPRAFRVARSVCASSAQAEDAVQEGFLSIWRGRARFDTNRADSFGAWSMTIVRYAAIDALRYEKADKRPRLTAEQSQPVDGGSQSPEAQAIVCQEADAIRAKLARLPEKQAEVIQLGFYGELSHSEIAKQLDLPPGTVKGRMRLGLERLRKNVDRET